MNIDNARNGKKVICTEGRLDGNFSIPLHEKHRLTSKGSNNSKYRNQTNQFQTFVKCTRAPKRFQNTKAQKKKKAVRKL